MPIWAVKPTVVIVELAGFLIGYWFFSRGAPMIRGLNQSYARYPGILGRFRYPSWWHRLMGGMFMAWGVLVAVIGAWKAQ
jgi:hypothetical protein